MESTTLATRPDADDALLPMGDGDERVLQWSGLFDSGGASWGESSDPVYSVTERTALRLIAVFAAVRILAEPTAFLPLHTFKRLDDDSRVRERNASDAVLNEQFNPHMTAQVGKETVTAHMLLWGAGYAEIVRDGAGRLKELWPLLPDRTWAERRGGKLVFKTWGLEERPVTLQPRDVWYLPAFTLDGITPLSPIGLARQSIARSLGAERYGAVFMKNAARPSGVIKHPERLKGPAWEHVKDSLREKYQGVEAAHRIMILEEGMEWQSIGIDPKDAQLLESEVFGIRQIARLFNVPLHRLSDLERATFSNIEHLGQDFITYSLRWILQRWTGEGKRKLYPNDPRYLEHLTNALLMGDTTSRYAAYHEAIADGWMSRQEVRVRENLPRGPQELETFLVPLNMAPAGDVPSPSGGGPEETGDAGGGGDRTLPAGLELRQRRSVDGRRRIQKSLRRVFMQVGATITRRETDRVSAAVKKLEASGDVAEFSRALDELYAGLEPFIVERMRPVLDAMAESVTGEIAGEVGQDEPEELPAAVATLVGGYAAAMAARHVKSSRGQIDAIVAENQTDIEIPVDDAAAILAATVLGIRGRVDEWKEKRPAKIADRETVESAGAFGREAYRSFGTTRLIWVTVGKNCPLCNSMNGRTVGIEESFLGPGDEVSGEGVSPLKVRNIVRHPQLHEGCNCQIAAA